MGFALLVGVALFLARLRGVTTFEPVGRRGVVAAMVTGVAGVSLFALGATFITWYRCSASSQCGWVYSANQSLTRRWTGTLAGWD